MTDPRPRVLEPGDFDLQNFKAPVFEGQTAEDCRAMPVPEKMQRIGVAWQQVRDAHRSWFVGRNPDATPVEVWGDWLRVTGCSVILAKAMRDAADRDADPPFVVGSA
ncbi:MAG: hypothetical protein C0501_20475 [Isosphaera sp.]|nr:hypothetical protein [Isosphaera sp.]